MANENRIAIPDVVRNAVVVLKPNATARFLETCVLAGITEHNVQHVANLCEAYKKPIKSVSQYMNLGLTLDRIEACLELQTCIEMTVPTANRFITGLNLQSEDPAMVIEVLIEAAGNDYLVPNRLIHKIRECFEGDFWAAYHLAIDDPLEYQRIMRRNLNTHLYRLREGCDDDE